MRILITSGGTSEAIDAVRSVTNTSTGRTGAALAETICKMGHQVILVHARAAILPAACDRLETHSYVSFKDLDALLRRLLREDDAIDAVIHCAAVSDFSPEYVLLDDGKLIRCSQEAKLDSSLGWTIHMKPNHKILDQLRLYSYGSGRRESVKVVGFKLTATDSRRVQMRSVKTILERGVCDLLVHNDLSGVTPDRHEATIYDGSKRVVARCHNDQMIAASLMRELAKPRRYYE